jgi:hypothetical protein
MFSGLGFALNPGPVVALVVLMDDEVAIRDGERPLDAVRRTESIRRRRTPAEDTSGALRARSSRSCSGAMNRASTTDGGNWVTGRAPPNEGKSRETHHSAHEMGVPWLGTCTPHHPRRLALPSWSLSPDSYTCSQHPENSLTQEVRAQLDDRPFPVPGGGYLELRRPEVARNVMGKVRRTVQALTAWKGPIEGRVCCTIG